jgi:hypothetical protein
LLSHHTAHHLGWALLIYGQDMDTETLKEIDEALAHAVDTRTKTIDSKKHIVDKFIDDLLDSRLELTKC